MLTVNEVSRDLTNQIKTHGSESRGQEEAGLRDEPVSFKTHGSESRGQEEAGLRDEPVSYLQVAPL